jgi:hypothetical protein
MARQRAGYRPETGTVYDQLCRFLLRLDEVALLCWLLRLRPAAVAFERWLDTRGLPWPGQPERICDSVAWLPDLTDGDRPWAVVLEFQLEPDASMFGRLLVYLGGVWLQFRPSELPGDRFCVGAVVVNLTGNGQSSRNMRLGKSRLRTHLGVEEWNLAGESAQRLLRQVKAWRIPRLALTFVPLMQGGCEEGIIRQWLELARQESDQQKQQALGLALVFAEKAGCADAWRNALEGFNVTESKIVQEWTARARAEGNVEMLREVLKAKFGALPADLEAALQRTSDLSALQRWAGLAVRARSLAAFREQANL